MPATSCSGRFNTFQRAMLQWDALHPYLAAHIVRMDGRLDAVRLRRVITARLQAHGLGTVQIDTTAGTFSHTALASDPEIEIIRADTPPLESLRLEVERQLHRPFPTDSPFCPFRFFAIPDADSFLLGLVYHHPMADAGSVGMLLLALAGDLAAGDTPANIPRLETHPPRHDRPWLKYPLIFARNLASLPFRIAAMRRSHRPPLHDVEDMRQRVRFLALERRELDRLRATAKHWQVTVNDLLLALLLSALAPLAPERFLERRRRNLSIGSIVNVRHDAGVDSAGIFGLFLASFTVSHPVPEGISLADLAADVHAQTQRIKSRRRALLLPLELALSTRLMALCSTSGRKKFYHKNHPLWAGITNMNLNTLRTEKGPDGTRDYFRAVSTGPVTPLVLAVTTFADHMNLGLTWRTAVYSEADMDRLQAAFTGAVHSLEGRP